MRIAYKRESKSLICVFELISRQPARYEPSWSLSCFTRGFIRGFTRAGRLLMGLCRRQIIRLRKKYTAQGERALIHGNRDRHSMPCFLGILFFVPLKSYPRRRKRRESNGL